MENKTILVTGGAGFIGSHLCKKLLSYGNNVIALDNFFTGRKANIKELFDDNNFEFIRHDITDDLNIEVDAIFNLACPASPVHYQYDPVKTVETNVKGTINVLRIAERTGAKVLQASTSEVYGNPKVHPQVEEYWGNVNPIGPRSCYDEGKRVAETLMFDYAREKKVDIAVVRIFNTYGPNMAENDGRVVSNFIMQALRNEDITIYGDGNQTRSFCYVDDMVRGLILMMKKDNFTGPVNLGNPDEKTILDLAARIKVLTESNSEIVFKEFPKDDPVRRKPNIELAKKELPWKPIVGIDQGLIETINYFKGKINE